VMLRYLIVVFPVVCKEIPFNERGTVVMFSILDNTLISRACFIECFDHLIGTNPTCRKEYYHETQEDNDGRCYGGSGDVRWFISSPYTQLPALPMARSFCKVLAAT